MSRNNRRNRSRGSRNNNGSSKSSSKRTKAEDLSYHPKSWEKQKYTIKAHFHGTLCQHLLDKTITKPPIDQTLATNMLLDDSRNQTDRPAPPDPGLLHPKYWHLTDLKSLEKFANSLDRNDPTRFFGVNYTFTTDDYTEESKSLPWGEITPSSGELQTYTPPEIDLALAEFHAYQEHIERYKEALAANKILEQKDEEPDPLPVHPRAAIAKKLQDWHKATADWRGNYLPDMTQHHKSLAAYGKTVLSANSILEYRASAPHVQHAMFTEADSMIYSFMNKFIDRKYKHLKNGLDPTTSKFTSKALTGVGLFDRCNQKQANPSVTSGVPIMNKITRAKQKPGQTFSQFLDYMTDLQDQYKTATGRPADPALVRVSLMQNLQEFYDTPINGLQNHDNINNTLTPITGLKLSVQSILEKYEADNPAKFAAYQALSSNRKKKKSRSGEANAVSSNRSNNNRDNNRGNNKSKWEGGHMPQQCTWCRTFLPNQPTSHDAKDCRIKAGFVNMTCHNCHQKGHPARMCPHKEGRAHSIEALPTKPQSSHPYGIANYISVSSPMTSKAARMKLKQMQHDNKKRKNDRRVRFRLIEVAAESDDDSS